MLPSIAMGTRARAFTHNYVHRAFGGGLLTIIELSAFVHCWPDASAFLELESSPNATHQFVHADRRH